METVKKNYQLFLAAAFGGPNEYKGRDLKTIH